MSVVLPVRDSRDVPGFRAANEVRGHGMVASTSGDTSYRVSVCELPGAQVTGADEPDNLVNSAAEGCCLLEMLVEAAETLTRELGVPSNA